MADVSLRMTRFIFNPYAKKGDTVLEVRGRPYGLSGRVLNFLRLNRQSYLIMDDTTLYFRSIGMSGLRDVIYTLDKVSGVQSGTSRSGTMWWGGLLAIVLGISLSVSLFTLGQPIALALIIAALGFIALLSYFTSNHLVISFTTDDQPAVNTLRFVVPRGETHHISREMLFQVIGYVNLVNLGGQIDRETYSAALRLKPINVALEAEDEIVLRVVTRPVMAQAASTPAVVDHVAADDLLALSPTEHWAAHPVEAPVGAPAVASAPTPAPASTLTTDATKLSKPSADGVKATTAPPLTLLEDDELDTTSAAVADAVADADETDTTEAETVPTVTMQADVETVGARPNRLPTTAPFVETPPIEPVLRPSPRDTAEQIAEAVSRGTGILPSLPSTADPEANDTRPVPSPAIKPVTGILRSAKDLFADGRILFDEGEKLARSGLVDESQAKYRAAIALLTKAIEIDPNYYKSFGGRAKCYEALGELEKAEQDWMLYRTLARTQGGTMSLRPPGM